ncbi:MBOAT family O-acyltransferase [Plebeiibacterium marinum]|uniref:MBOAT family protein n=1 Tax=Plebeiibacterium marinum TaxID=2992111 RepID=A0AAE3SI02_9BACT|nr:MBOAT family O-acyltransferase [Plebeiobacterium marinum]MCW3804127.1 hypothetical protein [Plebeiobacterium marinum]
MDIVSLYFICLVFVSAVVYYLLNRPYRNLFLVILSCGFIASLSIELLIYLIFYSLVNYFLAIRIVQANVKRKKLLYRAGIIINLSQLIILKYTSFTIDPILRFGNIDFVFNNLERYIIPVGVSYFTLQAIGYLINVKMGWEKPEKRFVNLLLYLTFFPKFISGPIERSKHFFKELHREKDYEKGSVSIGLKTILLGLFKKLVIANHLAPFVQFVYSDVGDIGTEYILLLFVVQPLYLYFDFSGYTDIAIGMARLFGINLLPNFNRPFLAQNITNFWKRFHISLSSWFNDYIFKQVSFRRRKWGVYASVYGLVVTWMLFGIWHGAGWNFMILGFVLALSILFEFFTKRQRGIFFSKLPQNVRVWLGRGFTFVFYGFALSFFFSPNLNVTILLFAKLFEFNFIGDFGISVMPLVFGVSLALGFILIEVLEEDYKVTYSKINSYWERYRTVRIMAYYIIAVFVLSELSGGSSFVYEMF